MVGGWLVEGSVGAEEGFGKEKYRLAREWWV